MRKGHSGQNKTVIFLENSQSDIQTIGLVVRLWYIATSKRRMLYFRKRNITDDIFYISKALKIQDFDTI